MCLVETPIVHGKVLYKIYKAIIHTSITKQSKLVDVR